MKSTPALVAGGDAQADVVEQAKARLLDTQVKAEQLRERYVGNVKPLQDAEQQIGQLKQFIGGRRRTQTMVAAQSRPMTTWSWR